MFLNILTDHLLTDW